MLYRLIQKFYHDAVYARNDDDGTIHYFSYKDFKGLEAVPYAFPSSRGHILHGYFYSYPNPLPSRLVVFDHGMGGGHRAYMKEIELLCSKGLMVLAYDHTGCMRSEGKTTGGFAQSLRDLDDCLKSLSKLGGGVPYDISVVGHSWGGFAAMNIGAKHPEVRRIVSISGFVSVQNIIEQKFGGLMKKAGERFYQQAKRQDPQFASMNALESLKKTRAKVLLIHSEDDEVVSVEGFDLLKTALEHRPNFTFLKVRHKGHNPNYTEQAVRYKDEFFATYPKLKKKLLTPEQKAAFVAAQDWHKMTEQDPHVWEHIFAALEV